MNRYFIRCWVKQSKVWSAGVTVQADSIKEAISRYLEIYHRSDIDTLEIALINPLKKFVLTTKVVKEWDEVL